MNRLPFLRRHFVDPRQFLNHSCRKPESRLPFPRNSGLVVAVSVLKGREYLAIDSNRILHHAKIFLKKFNTILNNQCKLNKYSEQGNNKTLCERIFWRGHTVIISYQRRQILYSTCLLNHTAYTVCPSSVIS